MSELQAETSTGSLGEWATKNKPKKRAAGIGRTSMDRALEEADRRRKSEEWGGARPLVFVALYVRGYEFVYGATPTFGGKERTFAASAAARILKNEFGGDAQVMSEFFRWVWHREHEREKWRRSNRSDSTFRITWRLMFSGTLLDDWRVAKLRGR